MDWCSFLRGPWRCRCTSGSRSGRSHTGRCRGTRRPVAASRRTCNAAAAAKFRAKFHLRNDEHFTTYDVVNYVLVVCHAGNIVRTIYKHSESSNLRQGRPFSIGIFKFISISSQITFYWVIAYFIVTWPLRLWLLPVFETVCLPRRTILTACVF